MRAATLSEAFQTAHKSIRTQRRKGNQNLSTDLFFHPAALLGFKPMINTEIQHVLKKRAHTQMVTKIFLP